MYEVLIIGSGPAGLSAAIYAIRANKKVAIIEGYEPGGQLMKTTFVENYPGFAKPILGPDLMLAMYEQVQNLNVEMIKDIMIDFERKNNIFEVKLSKTIIQTKTIIVATGSKPKMLGIEDKFLGYGISTCATCDGAFFKGKEIAVIGGGNSAVEEALYLSNIGSKIYLIHRRNELRAEKIMQDRLFQKNNIEIFYEHETKEFYGNKILEGIKIIDKTTKIEKDIKISAAFIAIGHSPNTSFLKDKIMLDESGYIKNGIITEIPGFFSAGDVFDHKYRQAITSAGFGCMAALEAINYLNMN